MVDILNRDLLYFRTLRNNKRLIESADIDSQFASVANYLNNEIIPAVNELEAGALPGINGSANYFLINVGDGTVRWNVLNNNLISNYSIPFIKLNKTISKGAVLISNNLGQLNVVGPIYVNQVLAYKDGNIPTYKFIEVNNIEDRAITGADIANNAIWREHLSQEIQDILYAPLPNVQEFNNINITGDQFEDLSITTDKFLNNSITSETKIGIINNHLPRAVDKTKPWYILKKHIKNNTITPDKIRPNTVGARNFNKVRCITKYKLAQNIIDDTWLRISPNSVYVPPRSATKESGYFWDFMLSPNFRITRKQLVQSTDKNWCLCKDDFTLEVRRAFEKAGCW